MRPLATSLTLLVLSSTPAAAQALQWEQVGFTAVRCDLSADVDGDGLPDSIIGDFKAGIGGVVTVRSGVTGALIHTIQGPADQSYGWQNVIGLGDLNGDGHAEIGFSGTLLELAVHDGLTGAILGFTADSGPLPVTKSLAAIGDVNGDGYDDIVIGRPKDNGGQVKVVSGRYYLDGTLPAMLWSAATSQPFNGRFGEDVITIADITGDGIDEIILSAPGEKGVTSSGNAYWGQLHCLSGADGSSIWARKHLSTVDTYFGASLANIGDFDGDGKHDIAVGAPWNAEKAAFAGAVYIMRGNNSGTLAKFVNPGVAEYLGSDVAACGDVDQDGTPDVLVGADNAAQGVGSAQIISGASMNLGGSSKTVIWSLIGVGGLGLKNTLSGGVDATGDGLPDFLTGSWGTASVTGLLQLWRGECVGGKVSYCSSTSNSTGKQASLHVMGPLSISANSMTLEARKCPPGDLGIFIYGTASNQVPFGDGFLCVGGSVLRLKPAQVIDAFGFAALTPDLQAAPFDAGAGAIAPGDTRYFQFWYRDPSMVGGSGFNLTNGRQVTFCP